MANPEVAQNGVDLSVFSEDPKRFFDRAVHFVVKGINKYRDKKKMLPSDFLEQGSNKMRHLEGFQALFDKISFELRGRLSKSNPEVFPTPASVPAEVIIACMDELGLTESYQPSTYRMLDFFNRVLSKKDKTPFTVEELSSLCDFASNRHDGRTDVEIHDPTLGLQFQIFIPYDQANIQIVCYEAVLEQRLDYKGYGRTTWLKWPEYGSDEWNSKVRYGSVTGEPRKRLAYETFDFDDRLGPVELMEKIRSDRAQELGIELGSEKLLDKPAALSRTVFSWIKSIVG